MCYNILHRVLVQCEWNADALHQFAHVLSLLQEPCLRQEALRFSFTVLQHILSNSSSKNPQVRTRKALSSLREGSSQLYEKCAKLMLLGVTDVWSAIRKESAKQTAALTLQFPSMDAIDSFIEQLLRIAIGSQCVRQETSVQTRWGEQDGALYTLSLLLSSICIEKRASVEDLGLGNSSGTASRVANDIRGGFTATAVASAPALHFNFGSRHPSVSRLPRSLVQSLKSVLYQCLRHEQLSVREHAAQCLKHYVDLCEEPMRLLIFQEAMSKLNRMKESSIADDRDDVSTSSDDNEHKLLEAFEAEGLLDVLAKLAPSLPSAFLLKHWKFVFPTLERYVMHIASSVRQKSSAVVLSLAKLSQTSGLQTVSSSSSSSSGSSREAALELLVEMMLGLSASQDHESTTDRGGGGTSILCWQQREGRMLSIEALVDLLGKDLLFCKFGTRLLIGSDHESKKKSQVPALKTSEDLVWATLSTSMATWTVDEDELADLSAATTRSEQTDGNLKVRMANQPLISLLSVFFVEKKTPRNSKSLNATEFWHRVLSGWLQQTKIAFASNQFELCRISRQVLPGLLRLSLWVNQLELLQARKMVFPDESDACWRWSCVKIVLLHVQFLRESVDMSSVGGDDMELVKTVQTGLESAWSFQSAMSNDKPQAESTDGSYDTESTIVRVEAQLMIFLGFSRSESKTISSLGLLESGLTTVHANLPSHTQLPQYATSKGTSGGDTSSVDRQLSISLVRLLPSIVKALILVITKQNSREQDADSVEKVTRCWLILERSVLSWLATDDMFRWITVDQNEAQLSLLKSLDGLLQCVPGIRSEDFNSFEKEFELILSQLERMGVLASGKSQQQRRLKESTLTHAISICFSIWNNSARSDGGGTIDIRCCQGIVQMYAQLAVLNEQPRAKSLTSQINESSWDDWDGDEDEPGELGNDTTSQLRATASADGGDKVLGGVADRIVSDAVSGWTCEQLRCFHASISTLAASKEGVDAKDAHALLLALVDRLGLRKDERRKD